MSRTNSLYDKVLSVTTDYFGPAARRFLDRQIMNHTQKKPSQLTKSDLSDLIAWISAAMAVLTDDFELRQEYVDRLKELTQNTSTQVATEKS